MLVKIRMLTRGPNRTRKKGQVVDVDDKRAAYLVAEKHAEEVTDGDTDRLQERQGLQWRS